MTLPVFKTGDWQLRCQWCVRLAHASAKLLLTNGNDLKSKRACAPSARRPRSGFRLRTPARHGLAHARKTAQVRLAHASANFSRQFAVAENRVCFLRL